VNHFTIRRSLDAPIDRIWEIVGNPGASPGRGVDVRVEKLGAADGTGLVRVVKVGRTTAREEITAVGPGRAIRYRLLEGAPVRNYTSGVALEESPGGGTAVSWDARFRPLVPGTGWAVSLMSKHTLNRVLDAVAESSGARVEREDN
jgi:polyketide cyclase/dehydrase/lipid transport protein